MLGRPSDAPGPQTGYAGRLALAEMLPIESGPISESILTRSDAAGAQSRGSCRRHG